MTDAQAEPPITREERLRRAAKVCVIFARNMAYYRAARSDRATAAPAGNFWRTVDGNFIDTCVLEWCKIFADRSAVHAWQNLVTDPVAFEPALYQTVEKTAEAFAAEVLVVRRYRDKFLAHLDSDRTMLIPHLGTMWRAVQFYFAHLLEEEMEEQAALRLRGELGCDLAAYYDACFAEARTIYGANLG